MTTQRKLTLMGIALVLILSLALNVSLLKSSGKFNIDSLKWTVKSQFLKIEEYQNGKIPLIRHQNKGIDYADFLSEKQTSAQKYLINAVGSNFSIFGLGKGEGFSGLPKGLPRDIAQCAVKLKLDKNLYFVDPGRFNEKRSFVFYQSDISTTSLIGSLITEGDCSIRGVYKLQKSVTAWVLSVKKDFKLTPEQLPAHFVKSTNDGYLIVTRLGELCKVETIVSENREFSCKKTSIDFSGTVKNTHFGVKSVLLNKRDLFVAYAINNQDCNRLEIKKIALDPTLATEESSRLIYKSPGCFNPETTELNAVGGRMIFSNPDKSEITFSLGNAEIWTGLETIAPRNDYGRVLEMNLSTGKTQAISSGHRNPQGLCFIGEDLYLSEQGPDGGDELNRIVFGRNYGWPSETYGMAYGEFVSGSVKNRDFASHDRFEKPLLSWVPAIAAGDLICPKNTIKGSWSNNFLLATLKDNSIRRMILDGGSIRVDERIPMGYRVRDILISENGQLVALTDEASIIQLKLIDR